MSYRGDEDLPCNLSMKYTNLEEWMGSFLIACVVNISTSSTLGQDKRKEA
jgi:hypothetical protein